MYMPAFLLVLLVLRCFSCMDKVCMLLHRRTSGGGSFLGGVACLCKASAANTYGGHRGRDECRLSRPHHHNNGGRQHARLSLQGACAHACINASGMQYFCTHAATSATSTGLSA